MKPQPKFVCASCHKPFKGVRTKGKIQKGVAFCDLNCVKNFHETLGRCIMIHELEPDQVLDLGGALKKLRSREQFIFSKRMEGHSMQEIATMLGLCRLTIEKNLTQIERRLRHRIAKARTTARTSPL